MLISYVIPVKNRAHYLKECLSSLQNQTVDKFEAVIVDDNSAEDIKKTVSGFHDKRFRYYFLNEDYGTREAGARNFGNILAKGDIIAVMDSDDLVFPERAKLTYEFYDKNPQCQVMYGKIKKWNEETGEVRDPKEKYSPTPHSLERLKTVNYIPHPATSYRKKIANLFPYNSAFRIGTDWDLWLRIMEAGIKINFLDEYLTKYRLSSSQMTKTNLDRNQIFNAIVKGIHNQSKIDEEIFEYFER